MVEFSFIVSLLSYYTDHDNDHDNNHDNNHDNDHNYNSFSNNY